MPVAVPTAAAVLSQAGPSETSAGRRGVEHILLVYSVASLSHTQKVVLWSLHPSHLASVLSMHRIRGRQAPRSDLKGLL